MPTLSGVTRDSAGAALGTVTVNAFDASTDGLVATGTSDASGNYTLSVTGAGPFYVVAHKTGTNFLAGTTRRDLASVADPVVATVHSLWTGQPTTDGAVISAKLLNAASSTRVAVSTSDTLSNPTYTAAVTPDATYKFAKHKITGKAANTEYWYAVEVDGVIDLSTKGRFKTLPAAGAANFSIVMGGCSENTNDAAFASISAMNPAPLFFLHMGDFHYQDDTTPSTAELNAAFDTSLARSVRGKTHREVPTVYMWDDHDYQGGSSGNGTGRTATNTDNVWRSVAAAFYRSRVPMLPASSVVGDAVYSSFVVGRMRFLICDLRSNKTAQTATDDVNKTMMGPDQKQWWKDQVTAAKTAGQAVAWLSGVPWHSAADTDTWFGYSTERTELANHIKDSGMSGKVFVLASDMHGLAYHTGVDYATGGGAITPLLQAGPLNRLSSNKGGPYTYGPFPGTQPQVNATQYAIMDVTDDGVTLNVTWRGINAADGTTKFTYSFTPLTTGTPAPATAPAQMAKPTVTAGNGQATVTLVAPNDGGSPILRYTLGGLPAGAVDQQAGTTALVRTVTGLANGVAVTTLTARAENAVGNGAYSAAANSFTPVAPSATGFDATGGTNTTPGDGYKYWTFNASDTLTVTSAGNVEYLVVAGGGAGSSGGSSCGGGGGAGGLRQGSLTLAAQAYAITVGPGGIAPTGSTGAGTNGGNSSIAALIEALGGGHGGHSSVVASSGGSGGGGDSATGFTAGGVGTSGQGNAGGAAFESTTSALRAGGGGGGAGGVGGAAASSVGGSGGAGVTVWGRQLAGGGGGAAQAGAGDGTATHGGGPGRNATTDPSGDGTANTGGGGGGGAVSVPAGNGGSGVVVIRRAI